MSGDNKIKLETFLEQYPEKDYFQIFPRLVLGWEIPDFISFALEIIKVNPDPEGGEVYFIEPPKEAWGNYPAKPGWLSLTKQALDRLGLAMGIKWLGGHRLDDGRDPDRMIWEQKGALVQLTGIDTFAEAYELNLATRREQHIIKQRLFPPKASKKVQTPNGQWTKWEDLSEDEREQIINFKADNHVLQMRDNFTQRVQTGAKLRVIRSVSGLPAKYRPEVLGSKSFAVLKIIVNPQTQQERLAYMGHLAHAGALNAAYPQGAPVDHQLAGPIYPQPAQIAGEVGGSPQEIPFELEEADGPEAATEPAGEPAAPVAASSPAEPAPAPQAPAGGASGVFIDEVRALFQVLKKLIGNDNASLALANAIKGHGQTTAEITNPEHQAAVIDSLKLRLDQATGGSAPTGAPSPQDPPARFPDNVALEIRYQGLHKMSVERLEAELNDMTKGYDIKTDPAKIVEIINGGVTHENLVEACIRWAEWRYKEGTA